MSVQIRPISADEVAAFKRAAGVSFGFDPTPDASERFRTAFEIDRLRAAVDGEQIVATFGGSPRGLRFRAMCCLSPPPASSQSWPRIVAKACCVRS